MDPFEVTVSQNCKALLQPDDNRPIIVGLSGGADSVCLLAALTGGGIRCIAAHCNFHLRGKESARDMHHAEAVARELGVEFIVKHFDTLSEMATHGISAEMAARQLRYDWFARLLIDYQAQAIAVGHHLDDNIETMFLNLLRGSGIHGLRGMKPRRGDVIRPMLNIPRSEIAAYLQRRGLRYVVDSTNHDISVPRNRLRHNVLPSLYENFPGAKEAIARSLAMMRDCDEIYTGLIKSEQLKYRTERGYDLLSIARTTAPVSLLFELLHPFGFSASQCADMMKHPDASSRTFLSSTHVATSNRGELILNHNINGDYGHTSTIINLTDGSTWPVPVEISIITPAEFSPERDGGATLYLDADLISSVHYVWRLRTVETGDRMEPFGMKGRSQLLSDILKNTKLPLPEKKRQLVLTCDDRIIWVLGVRTSCHFAVTMTTKKILRIHIQD